MADLVLGQEFAFTFQTSPNNITVRTRISPKHSTSINNVRTVERAKEMVQAAFSYIDQFPMGNAILRTVTKDDFEIRIWFVNGGGDALSPPNTTANPTANVAVKWCPVQVQWFFDCGRSTERRNRSCFPRGTGGKVPFDGNLVVRSNDPMLVYDDKNPPHVMGTHSAPMVLMHELGHLVQYFRRPHYFQRAFTEAWNSRKSHLLIDKDGNLHDVPDIDAPWEVDNVNWNEQPFVKQARAAGLCEGYKAHYSDSIGVQIVDDVELVRVGTLLVPKVKVGATWYHLNAAWKVKSETSVSQLYIAAKKTEQKRMISGLGNLAALTPSAKQIKDCYDKFLKA